MPFSRLTKEITHVESLLLNGSPDQTANSYARLVYRKQQLENEVRKLGLTYNDLIER